MPIRHGLYKDASGKKSRLYHIWEDMKNRCSNPKNRRYHRYGGRGISVCKEWQDDYAVFYKWAIENGYADNLTIDRDKVDGNYEPGNCNWATQKQQGNNRANNRRIEYNGVSKTLAEWADLLGVKYHLLKNRLERDWTVERAFTTPPEKHNKRAA